MVEGTVGQGRVQRLLRVPPLLHPLRRRRRTPLRRLRTRGGRMKNCTACGNRLAFAGFHKDSSTSDGLRGDCKDCHNARVRKQHRDSQDGRTYSKTPVRDVAIECEKCGGERRWQVDRWRCKACDKVRRDAWRAANKERHRETRRKWQAANRDKATASTRRYRAKKKAEAQ